MADGDKELQNRTTVVRVCYAITRLSNAGTETQLLDLIRLLDRRKVKPYLCLLDSTQDSSTGLSSIDCPIIDLGIKRFRHFSTLVKSWRFVQFLRREQIDVVQPFFPECTYFAAPLAKLAGVKTVIGTRRNNGYWMTPMHARLGRIYNRCVINKTIANCEAARTAMIQQERARPDAVHVIENGIDLSRFADVDNSADGHTPRRVGMVANLRWVKGPDVLICAAGILRNSHPGIAFLIAGGGDVQPFVTLAHEQGVADNLEFLGPMSDVPDFLAKLDVAVLASRAEGLSNSLLEYMAADRAIVATAVGGNVELIDDGVNGCLVPADDPQALADSIAHLLDHPALAAKLGKEAGARVRVRNAWPSIVRKYEEFYGSLVD